MVLKDPSGFGWWSDRVKDAKDIGLGVFDGVLSDISGNDVRTGDQNSDLYQAAKFGTHVADLYVSTEAVLFGEGMVGAGLVAAPETLGGGLVISGTGVGVMAAGTVVGGHALSNIMKSQANSSKLRNGHLAGKKHPKTEVPFDEDGFPDFSDYLYKGGKNDVMIKPTGNRTRDFDAANKKAGYKSTPKGYTWHHHQTTGRMQLVRTDVHKATGHTGGFSLWKVKK